MALQRAVDPAHADGAHVERAWLALQERDFKKVHAETQAIAASSSSSHEADYVDGLAHFHDGKLEAAQKCWKALITKAQDRFIYRADWAYTQSLQAKDAGKRAGAGFSTAGPRDSLFDRIGYMGREHPDLLPLK